ncbi:MAG: DNA polymerase III subunit gamma/tau, partial [Pseudonocardiaceae bacterium]
QVLHRLERLERRLAIVPSPVAEPPPVQPSVAQPPVAQSPPVQPPAARPPVAQPPPVQSPVTQSPVTQSPVTQPPVTQPPVTQPPVTQPPVTQPPAPVGAQPGPAPDQLDAAAVRRVWPALLDAVREQSRTTQVLLSNATASAVQGSTLILTLPTAPLARRLGDDRNVELIRAALRTVLGVDWQVRCEHVDAEAGAGGENKPQHTAQRAGRPPQRSAERPAYRRPAASQPADDAIPPPPEPADPGAAAMSHAPVDDDEVMLVEAAGMSQEHPSRRDPEEVALELLATQLGARRIDDR